MTKIISIRQLRDQIIRIQNFIVPLDKLNENEMCSWQKTMNKVGGGLKEEDPPKSILYLAMTLEKPLGCENKDLYDLKAFSKMLKC